MNHKQESVIAKYALLSEKHKRIAYYRLCFMLWRDGSDMITVPEFLFGAWFHFSSLFHKAFNVLSIEERALFIAGLMIGLLYLLTIAARLG